MGRRLFSSLTKKLSSPSRSEHRRDFVGWRSVPVRQVPLPDRRASQRPERRTVVYSAYWEGPFNDGKLYFSNDAAKRVIMPVGAGADSVFRMFEREVATLVKMGKKVFLVLPNPNSPTNNPASMLPRRLPWPAPKPIPRGADMKEIVARSGFVRDRLIGIASRTGAVIVDPMAYLCNLSSCATLTAEGRLIYSDDHHFQSAWVRHNATFMDQIVAGDAR